ncbi:MAG: hypothetical protein J1F31_05610 [Erysipelotrichales bacterium]|nr:hypothetical protein [Erysipelotrichales bacterium]
MGKVLKKLIYSLKVRCHKTSILNNILFLINNYFKYKSLIKSEKDIDFSSIEKIKRGNSILYKRFTGDSLDWNNLISYSEKMQYAKIFDRDKRKVDLADKIKVHNWVREKLGNEYLIPIISYHNKFSEINWEKLPENFVIKTNCASGDTIVVQSKSKLSFFKRLIIKQRIKYSLKTDYGKLLLEWHYSQINPKKIVISKYIDGGEKGLTDYKFFCFDGKPYFCQVETDRFGDRKVDVYDMNWNKLPWNQQGYLSSLNVMNRPKNFEKMIEIVNILSKSFSHVRVDLFNLNGKIYFGEMSFTNESGFRKFIPEDINLALGKMWNLKMN